MDVALANEITEANRSTMSEQIVSTYFELRPVSAAKSLRPRHILPEAQMEVLDGDFSRGGAWAGVNTLIEQIYLDLVECGSTEILEQHNYELYMVLAQHRSRIPLKRGSLTDQAVGAEKTRNFPLDRAYRLGYGLIDLVIKWRMAAKSQCPHVIVVENFSRTEHLARRFFMDLARRASERANLVVIVACDNGRPDLSPWESYLSSVPVTLPSSFIRNAGNPDAGFASEVEAEQCLARLTTLDNIELNYNKLLAHYRSSGDNFRYAKTALAALQAYNHLGYYYEASTFVDAILPYFDRLVEGSEEDRWNSIGNLYHSQAVQGKVNRAREIIEDLAKPFLTQKALCAKMEYILGILALRHTTPPDLPSAEEHLTSALDFIGSAREKLEPHEYAFFKVFIENGLALLRVRQGRKEEAIRLCQAGYQLLTRELGPEKHKLHRSVLQYNTAQVYTMMGDLEAALRYYGYAMQMDPNYSEYYNDAGNIYQRQGRFDEALASYETAIKLSPPYPEVFFNRGICFARKENWQMALQNCALTLELNPLQPDAHVLYAEIWEHKGNVAEALASYNRAIELAPELVVARVNKAVLLFDQGLFDSALTEMNAVIALQEFEPSHYENRAAIHEKSGRWDLSRNDQKRAEWLRLDAEEKQTVSRAASA